MKFSTQFIFDLTLIFSNASRFRDRELFDGELEIISPLVGKANKINAFAQLFIKRKEGLCVQTLTPF